MNSVHDSLHRIVALTGEPGMVTGRITDNVHDFGVVIRHDGRFVTDVEGQAYRVPWTTCPGATERLAALVGTPLRRDDGPAPPIDKGQQCTHLFDLAKLAIAFAPTEGARRYDIRVVADGPDGAIAWLEVDGAERLRWMVGADRVVRDGPFAGHLTTGAARWPAAIAGDATLMEAAVLLRRALLVFFGRRLSGATLPAEALSYMAGACFSFQPEQMAVAYRPPDFRDLPAAAVSGLAEAPPPPSLSSPL